MAKSFTLRNIPPDVFQILLIEQNKARMKSKGVYGLNQVVYQIIRDYERCRKAEERDAGR